MFSGVIDRSPRVDPGSTPLQPTTRADFRVNHGKKSIAQRLLGGLGRQIDLKEGQYIPRPTPRWQAHNCLPWRTEHCVSSATPFQHPEHLSASARSPTGQWQPFNPAAVPTQVVVNGTPPWQPINPGPFLSRDLTPSTPAVPQWQPFSPGPPSMRNIVSTPNFHSPLQQVRNPSPTAPRAVEVVVERIRHLLLHYLCDGGGADATEDQRRRYTEDTLKDQFQAPITLGVQQLEIGQCEEFLTIRKVVESCLEVLHVRGLRLVPELNEDGWELIVHVAMVVIRKVNGVTDAEPGHNTLDTLKFCQLQDIFLRFGNLLSNKDLYL